MRNARTPAKQSNHVSLVGVCLVAGACSGSKSGTDHGLEAPKLRGP